MAGDDDVDLVVRAADDIADGAGASRVLLTAIGRRHSGRRIQYLSLRVRHADWVPGRPAARATMDDLKRPWDDRAAPVAAV